MDESSPLGVSSSFDNYNTHSAFQGRREQHLPQDGVTFIALRSSVWRSIIYWLLVVFTGGIFFLAAKILPYVQSKVRFSDSTLDEADRILVKRVDEGATVYEIIKVYQTESNRFVEYMYYRYIWMQDAQTLAPSWIKIKYELGEKSFKELFTSRAGGISSSEAVRRVDRYGTNSLDVPVPSYFKLFYTEVIHPFYIFQVVSIIIWLNDDYWIYASCIFVMAVASALYSVWQSRKNREMLAEMCLHEDVVRVLRKRQDHAVNINDLQNGHVDHHHHHQTQMDSQSHMDYRQVSSRDIAPGDLVEIRADMNLPCDLLLVRGHCVVNESALTGESVPVAKVSIPSQETEVYHPDVHGAKHVLYNGTSILQTRPDSTPMPYNVGDDSDLQNGSMDSAHDDRQQTHVLGLAINTGFATAKGDLIRSILFPRPTRFKFYRDSMRFVGVLFLLSLLGFVYTIVIFTHWGSPVGSMMKRALDLITIAVPPALPIAMSIATAFAVSRLKKQSIFCTSPQRVNVSGRIDVMCFDKTGTLTEDHLDVHGVLPVRSLATTIHKMPDQDQELESLPSVDSVSFKKFLQDIPSTPTDLLHALACCHSLNMLHGNLIGDPLEVKMFEATGWNLADSGHVRSKDMMTAIHTQKFFEFSSLLQRMSVITETDDLSNNPKGSSLSYQVYTKGAPEVIKSLCIPSTVPPNFDKELSAFTQQGKRVLALARKPLDLPKDAASSLTRADAETQLTFLGLFVLQNQLKDDTTEAILNITGGTVASVMVTGDNEFTAMNVARQCGILAETDLNGDASVYLITVQYENDIPIGLKYSYIPGFDPNGPDGESKRHSIVDPHASGTYFPDTLSDTEDFVGDRADLFGYGLEKSRTSAGSPSVLAQKVITSIDDIPHSHRVFAVHGKAFEYIRSKDRDLFAQILSSGRVYARMSPIDKTHLIEGLQTLGHTVGMCGDGANDVGALKAADVGLSLSEAEASVAAPFTSKVPSIRSMRTLLREGRGALASSISCYKYMAVYSMIQLETCVILYSIWWDSRLTDPQFLWIDIFLVFPLSFLMGRTEPRPELSGRKPPGALVSISVVGSVIIQTILHFLCQLGFFMFLTNYYVPHYHPEWDLEQSMYIRVGTLFMFANFEYVGTCLAYSIARPWRAQFWTNIPFFFSLIVLFFLNIYMVVYPANWVANLLSIGLTSTSLEPLELWLVGFLLGCAFVEMALSFAIERLIIIAWIQPYEERSTKLQVLESWADDTTVPYIPRK